MEFRKTIASAGHDPLRPVRLDILQVNLGYRCNIGCKHCHIGAGPERVEMMDRQVIDEVLKALEGQDIRTVDITGGAPELNPHFRYLIVKARDLGCRVIVRTNLTVLGREEMAGLPEFFAQQKAEIVASLASYMESAVDRVRGNGTFRKSIEALRMLNSLGYGLKETGLRLSLVHNPQGAFLAPPQKDLEEEYEKELSRLFGITFDSLYTFTNMPVGRFREFLARTDNLERYMDRLVSAFNRETLDGLMCRHLVSVGWDGILYDCDFNQALGLPIHEGYPRHVRDFDRGELLARQIVVGDHCYGCTAGQGST